MPDVVLTRRQTLFGDVESPYATDANPQHTNSYQAVRLIEPFVLDLGQEIVDVTGGTLSRGFGRPVGTVRPAGVSFKAMLVGLESGSYTTTRKPPLGQFLRAAGLFETFVSSDASGRPVYRYDPPTDVGSDVSLTIVAHQDGFEHRFLGCRGNVNLVYGAASPVVAEFTFRGILSTEAATTRTGNVSLNTQTPPRWIGSGSVFIESLSARIEALNFNTNYDVLEERASVAVSGSGIVEVFITNRQPGGSFDMEATLPGSYDAIGAWRSSSGGVLQLNVGNTQGNRFTLTCSQVVYRQVGWGDKQGLSIFNNDYQATERSGSDEVRLEFN